MPNYLVSYSDHKVILRNYEGYITTYEEPNDYQPHDQANCAYCQNPRPEPGQEGISGLLDGKRMWIEPAGFQQVHDRGAEGTHRLKDPSKWVPLGVGAIEGSATETARTCPSSRPEGPRRSSRPRLGAARPWSAQQTTCVVAASTPLAGGPARHESWRTRAIWSSHRTETNASGAQSVQPASGAGQRGPVRAGVAAGYRPPAASSRSSAVRRMGRSRPPGCVALAELPAGQAAALG